MSAAAALAATLSTTLAEQIVIASSHGEIQTVETESGALLNQFYMATDAGSGPAGVAFKSRDEMLISVNGGFGGEKIFQFHSSGAAAWAGGLKFVQGNFDSPLLGSASGLVPAGPQGIVYGVGGTSHDLWAFAGTRSDRQGNLYLSGSQVMRFSITDPRLMFTRDIAASRLDNRLAVAGGQRIRILNGTTWERDILAGGNVEGLAFDPIGREVNGEKHPLIYALSYPSDAVRVERFDAVTGEPWGADPANRANAIFIAAGAGGLANYASDLAIDPFTGDIYIAASSTHRTGQFGDALNCLNRFDKDGNPKGIITDRENSAVITTLFNSGDVALALRPRYQISEATNDGSFTLTPGAAGFGFAGLNFIANNDAGAVVRLDGAQGPAIKVGGEESDPIRVEVPAGLSLAVQNLVVGAKGLFNLGEGSRVDARGAALLAASYLNLTLAAVLDVGAEQPFLAEPGSQVGGVGKIVSGIGALIRGVLSPGQSPGKLTVEGNLALTAESDLKIELAGTEQGVTCDHLDVRNTIDGFVALRGKLSVIAINGFAAQLNASQTFDIVTAESAILASFSNLIDGRVLTADGRGTFAVRLVNDNKTLQLADYQPFAGTPYEAWAQLNFTAEERANATVSGRDADPDSDGASNFTEFAFNANPKVAAAIETTAALSAASPNLATLEFQRRAGGTGTAANYVADGVRYEVLQSADLTAWNALSGDLAAQTQTQANADGVTETLRINIGAGQPAAAFFKLRITAE